MNYSNIKCNFRMEARFILFVEQFPNPFFIYMSWAWAMHSHLEDTKKGEAIKQIKRSGDD